MLTDGKIVWTRADEVEGNRYEGNVAGESMVYWLCPALFCYFTDASQRIYVKADPLPEGIGPLWPPEPSERTQRFVESE